jgi:hypothetical protein
MPVSTHLTREYFRLLYRRKLINKILRLPEADESGKEEVDLNRIESNLKELIGETHQSVGHFSSLCTMNVLQGV